MTTESAQGKKKLAGWAIASLLTGVFLGGSVSLGGLNAAMDWTNREEFCISCHEMQATPYSEYQDSAHDLNRAGVKTTCSDCHVPKEWGSKVLAKIWASKDLVHHFLGTIDSPEKYENRRLHMAKSVWQFMKKTDSKTCRNCHAVAAMDLDQQEGRARRKHSMLVVNEKTCIDCHKGIAHELPDGFEEDGV